MNILGYKGKGGGLAAGYRKSVGYGMGGSRGNKWNGNEEEEVR